MAASHRPLLALPSSSVGKGLLFIGSVWMLALARPVLLPIAIAIVLSFVLSRPVRALRRLGLPEFIGAGVLLAALLGGVALIGGSVATPAVQWWQRAPTTLEQLLARLEGLRESVPVLGGAAASTSAASRDAPAAAGATATSASASTSTKDSIRDRLATEGIALTGAVLGRTLSFVLSAASTVILLYFLLACEHWMLPRAIATLPDRRRRARVLVALRRAQRDIGHFLATLALMNLAVGCGTALALWGLGLPNPTLWGTAATVLSFIPYIGPVIMAAMLLLAGLLTFDTAGAMLAPSAAFLMLHALESGLISPWFIGRRLSLSPVAVFVSVMIFGWLWGLAGAMIAVPILIGLRCVLRPAPRWRLLCAALEGQDAAAASEPAARPDGRLMGD